MNKPDPTILYDIVTWRMPYGRFKGRLVCDLPLEYLHWIKQREMPAGRLGILLENVYELKYHDMYDIISGLKDRYAGMPVRRTSNNKNKGI